jgi:hypothetical protein
MRSTNKYTDKWWVNLIRFMNYLAYRFWWFVWITFIIGILAWFYFCPCNKNELFNCNYNNLKNSLNEINNNLNTCCNCSEEIDTRNNHDSINHKIKIQECNAKTNSGGEGITTTIHELGVKPGKVIIDFNTHNVPDKIEVFYENKLVASTNQIYGNDNGFVGGSNGIGQLQFFYSQNIDKFCTVVVTGNNDTDWQYIVNCPK